MRRDIHIIYIIQDSLVPFFDTDFSINFADRRTQNFTLLQRSEALEAGNEFIFLYFIFLSSISLLSLQTPPEPTYRNPDPNNHAVGRRRRS